MWGASLDGAQSTIQEKFASMVRTGGSENPGTKKRSPVKGSAEEAIRPRRDLKP